MADLRIDFAGIRSPNPFWLASAPPTDKAVNVHRAFEAGWGGVVWKTLGEAGPPVVNVNGPRYGALLTPDRKLLGFNNIELITDRDLEVNLREIAQVKRDWPDRAMVVSLMVPCEEAAWKSILPRVEDTGCDGIELNFGCPHGMSERGMGAAVGQVPEYIEMVTAWCKRYSRLPVIVKLTPNITDVRYPARAARAGGADAVSLINTINSIIGVDPATLTMTPATGGMGSHGGYCGPAVKPIALNMVAEIARDPKTTGMPISGIGGIVYGFKIVQEMSDGLSNYMDEMGFSSIAQLSGRALPSVTDWKYLNLNHVSKAVIDQDLCIQCGRCHIACEDTSHQAITATVDGQRRFVVKEQDCVGCNLCVNVCPVPDCITLRDLAVGEVDARTGEPVSAQPLNWTEHPNNAACACLSAG